MNNKKSGSKNIEKWIGAIAMLVGVILGGDITHVTTTQQLKQQDRKLIDETISPLSD